MTKVLNELGEEIQLSMTEALNELREEAEKYKKKVKRKASIRVT